MSGSSTASGSEGTDDLLKAGFTRTYIDPHDYAKTIALRLTQNMTDYCKAKSGKYVAPYTSLVTSSMMGKTRLMKELAKYVPVVYMCFRKDGESGYPRSTEGLLAWLEEGACRSLGIKPNADDIVADNGEYIIPTLKHSLFLLYLFHNLDKLINELLNDDIDHELNLFIDHKVKTKLRRDNSQDNFEWMWQFFSDHGDTVSAARSKFWLKVRKDTDDTFINIRSGKHTVHPYQSTGRSQPSLEIAASEPEELKGNWAYIYLDGRYKRELRVAHTKLHESFVRFWPKFPLNNQPGELTLILCFDEARHLCTSSADTDNTIYGATSKGSPVEEGSRGIAFSNFRAMRRALRYLRQAKPFPRVFGLFTDTTSRLTNFQPHPLEDRSLRLTRLPIPGKEQFKPIHVFTSIDAHSKIADENYAISNHQTVAEIDRLLKFGRAGWYSLYTAKSNSKPTFTYYTKPKILEIAISKLLGIVDEALHNFGLEVHLSSYLPMPPQTRLRLLAVLSPRLALTVGPFSAEAVEMVSSHLAVLLRTDEDRHFLQTYYPSEPILAEASAVITKSIGWSYPLKALYHYLQNGIVTAGYRGELLSKVLCLMAMDDTEKPETPDPEDETALFWTHTQPVKVRDFLDSWLTPPAQYLSFSAALSETDHVKLVTRRNSKDSWTVMSSSIISSVSIARCHFER